MSIFGDLLAKVNSVSKTTEAAEIIPEVIALNKEFEAKFKKFAPLVKITNYGGNDVLSFGTNDFFKDNVTTLEFNRDTGKITYSIKATDPEKFVALSKEINIAIEASKLFEQYFKEYSRIYKEKLGQLPNLR